MQLRFKIKSYSSQSNSYPIGNLLSKHSWWQSQRFCDYPQIITIAFYQPSLIKSIKIASHPTKISSRINILYHLPQRQDQGYSKYGFITFTQNTQPNNAIIEMKQLCDVQIRALQIRLLLLQNHMSKQNFFNQVGLSSISFTGVPFQEYVIPTAISNNSSLIGSFQTQISLLTQLKKRFIKKQAFEQVKQVKQILDIVLKANEKMAQLQNSKKIFIKDEDYMAAKKIKEEMISLKSKITDIVNESYDPKQNTLKSTKSDFGLVQKIEELGNLPNSSNTFENTQGETSRLDLLKEQQEQKQIKNRDQCIINYQDRILPAVMSRIKGMASSQLAVQSSQIGDNEFFQSKQKDNVLPSEPQILTPADQANSSYLLEFYDNLFIRKIHSRYWQFRLQAINQVITDLKDGKTILNKNKLRCYLFIYSLSLKSHNYQTSNAAIELMNLLAPMKMEGQYKNQLHNQLENVIRITLKKMNDSNQKIKNQAQKTLLRIIESSLFGVAVCYSSLIKSYSQKTSAKLRKTKLQDIDYMVQKYGIGENKVPMSVVDFALKASNDQDADVRKCAIDLLKSVKLKGGKDKLDNILIESKAIKKIFAKQL